jgi:aldehyde dehydrogenase (NAD+)
MQEEIFGPILPILKFSNVSEVIQVVNDHPTSLAVYIFSKDQEFKKAFDDVATGALVYNDCMVHFINPSLPFGGIGSSGM